MKKFLLSTVAGLCMFSTGFSTASAAEVTPFYTPLEASISIQHESQQGTSATPNRKVNWGGGQLPYWNIDWNDGITTRSYKKVQFYSTSFPTSYSLFSNYSSYTWSNKLTVSNGTSTKIANGSFRLYR